MEVAFPNHQTVNAAMFLTVLLVLFGVLFLIKIYFVHSSKQCKNYVCLNGKTALITGANTGKISVLMLDFCLKIFFTGIGFQAALEFAKRGARVILACRDQEKANQAREKIIELTQNENISLKLVKYVPGLMAVT